MITSVRQTLNDFQLLSKQELLWGFITSGDNCNDLLDCLLFPVGKWAISRNDFTFRPFCLKVKSTREMNPNLTLKYFLN